MSFVKGRTLQLLVKHVSEAMSILPFSAFSAQWRSGLS